MNFVLINSKNKKHNFYPKKTIVQPFNHSSQNYKISRNLSEKTDNLNTKSLKNMFSLIKYANTSCGSCGGAR